MTKNTKETGELYSLGEYLDSLVSERYFENRENNYESLARALKGKDSSLTRKITSRFPIVGYHICKSNLEKKLDSDSRALVRMSRTKKLKNLIRNYITEKYGENVRPIKKTKVVKTPTQISYTAPSYTREMEEIFDDLDEILNGDESEAEIPISGTDLEFDEQMGSAYSRPKKLTPKKPTGSSAEYQNPATDNQELKEVKTTARPVARKVKVKRSTLADESSKKIQLPRPMNQATGIKVPDFAEDTDAGETYQQLVLKMNKVNTKLEKPDLPEKTKKKLEARRKEYSSKIIELQRKAQEETHEATKFKKIVKRKKVSESNKEDVSNTNVPVAESVYKTTTEIPPRSEPKDSEDYIKTRQQNLADVIHELFGEFKNE